MKHALAFAAAFALCTGVLLAQDAADDAAANGKAAKVAMLDRNVRLDFEMVPEEEGAQSVFVVTASSRFEVNVSFKGQGAEMEFEASGEIALRDDGTIFVLHQTHVEFEGGEGRARFHVSSGVLLKPDEPLEVARMGDRTLVIVAAYIDQKKP